MHRFDDSILRMIDANLNRTREGLRVMEDCARFGIDDAKLSERLKIARHALRSAIEACTNLRYLPEKLAAAERVRLAQVRRATSAEAMPQAGVRGARQL